MPHFVQGAAGKEAAPHHNVSAKKRITLKNNRTFFLGGGKTVDYSRIFTFHGVLESNPPPLKARDDGNGV
jgi:hypothetical protein